MRWRSGLVGPRAGWLVRALLVTAVGALVACGGGSDDVDVELGAADVPAGCEMAEPEQVRVEVLDTLPHPTDAYTQGAVARGDELLISTGLVGESTLRVLDVGTGEELSSVDLPAEVFGEGLALAGDGAVQLTWTDGVAYRWNADMTEIVDEYTYDGEGWGLTTLADGTLVMSDGSERLTWRDPDAFDEVARGAVRRVGGSADMLNELEFDGESIWANRYTTDELLRIDPDCLVVTGVADLSELREDAEERAAAAGDEIDVTNGVAHLPDSDTFILMGKWWPTMYHVRLTDTP